MPKLGVCFILVPDSYRLLITSPVTLPIPLTLSSWYYFAVVLYLEPYPKQGTHVKQILFSVLTIFDVSCPYTK